jgi:hypothetical protein
MKDSVHRMNLFHPTAAPQPMFVQPFYDDIARWTPDKPARWAYWVARCPVKAIDDFAPGLLPPPSARRRHPL